MAAVRTRLARQPEAAACSGAMGEVAGLSDVPQLRSRGAAGVVARPRGSPHTRASYTGCRFHANTSISCATHVLGVPASKVSSTAVCANPAAHVV